MTDEVYERLMPCVHGKRTEDAIFTSGRTAVLFRVTWENMCAAAKVSILLHDFRRTAIRNMIRAGVPEKTAMRISGHVTRPVFGQSNL